MGDYKKLTAKEFAERLLEIKCPTVLMHRRPDGDTIGTAAALIKTFASLGVKAEYACADAIPERLKFLLDGLTKSDDLTARELVAVDVAAPEQLGSLAYVSERVSLMLDHHAVGKPFADYYIISNSSSAGETLFEVIEELIAMKKLTLTPEIAYPLYASVSSDTGGFRYSSTSPKTHRRAAALVETGIDFADINHKLFNSKSESQLRAEGFISSKILTAEGGKIAYATLTKSERETLRISNEHFETAIDVIRSLYGVEVALFVKENDDGTIRASLRSTGADVAKVASLFSGGGHIRASGCSPVAESVSKAANMIIDEIKKVL